MNKPSVALILMVLSQSGFALEVGHGNDWQLSFSGFGTLGGVYSTNEDVGYYRDISQRHGARGFSYDLDSRFGLQANLKLFDRIEFIAQGVSRHRYDNTYEPELTMGFAKVEPMDGLNLRLGRLLSDFFMLTESRNIGYSYLTLRPPVEYFSPLFFYHFDGGDLAYTLPIDENLLTVKAYVGNVNEDFPVRNTNVYDTWDVQSLYFGGLLEYLWGDWKARVSYTGLTWANNIPTFDQHLFPLLRSLPISGTDQIISGLSFKNRYFNYFSGAISWNPSPFSADFAIHIIDENIGLIPTRFSGFLTMGYRINKVTPFVSLAWTLPIDETQIGRLPTSLSGAAAINDVIDGSQTRTAYKRYSVSTGLRYDFMTNMAAKFQVDFVQGNPNVGTIWEFVPGQKPFDGTTVVIGAGLDFVF